ncbi:hypothetical protein [Bradyrhizobium iriomotense]|uniref:Uncharacterized protein n=1 Tax=Bradyrhizobium iriomotense TaxID=441950 RepID=A0ABQ6BFE5_9BRAD|nr:hypothetical protein [Bradyrhizobium iriomotense]GLR90893.1 hypothetical protein GCM10007857_76090 [Bradyrhizobium iriomotense]
MGNPVANSSGHPIAIGSSVPAYIINDDAELRFEGFTRVVSHCESYPHWYRVRFEREQVDRVRLILPPLIHNDPWLTAELLRELWRTRGLSPWTEFFPVD